MLDAGFLILVAGSLLVPVACLSNTDQPNADLSLWAVRKEILNMFPVDKQNPLL